VVKSLGSWESVDTSSTSVRDQSDVTAFQQGWSKTSTTENEAMVVEAHCKNFVIIYRAANPGVTSSLKGTIRVTYVNKNDSTDTGTMEWDMTKDQNGSNGWENPVAVLLIDKDSAADYQITFQFTETSGTGTIFALGYTA